MEISRQEVPPLQEVPLPLLLKMFSSPVLSAHISQEVGPTQATNRHP